jgi:hypothetical protein
METHSQSKSNPSRPIGSKLKKKLHIAKDAACGVVLDSSGVKEKHYTTLVAVSTSSSIKINNKMKGNPRAAAVPTGSSGNDTTKPNVIAVGVFITPLEVKLLLVLLLQF